MKKRRMILIFGLLAVALFIPIGISDVEEIIVQLPINSVIMYHGSVNDFDIFGYMINNTDWHLCNGKNNTPNMESKFVVGYNPEDNPYDKIGKTGGLETVRLNISEMPDHEHTYLDFFHVVTTRGLPLGNEANAERLISQGATTGQTGGIDSHENRPPYYVIMYIIKLSDGTIGEGNITGNFYYSEIWFHDDDDAVITSIGVQNQWYNVTGFDGGDINGEKLNGFSHDGIGNLTCDISGLYDVTYGVSFGNIGNNQEYQFSIFVNDVAQDNSDSHTKIGAGGDVQDGGRSCFIALDVNDVLNLRTRNNDGVSDVLIHSCDVNLMRIGD